MLSFYNSGTISEVSITTFGINAKENDSAIGYFGTGLKYAIAVLLRNNVDITIKSGKESFKFSLQDENVRGKEFRIVCMNGKPLGFTTELGKNWELWMAYRELYCNAKDEGGGVYPHDVDEKMFDTVIKVDGLDDIHATSDEFILQSSPIAQTEGMEVHRLRTNGIFYKGILVGKTENMHYSYNLHSDVKLTEDRTVKSEWDTRYAITKEMQKLNDKDLINILVTSQDGYESNMLWTSSSERSAEFEEVTGRLIDHQSRLLHPRIKEMFKEKIESALLNATKSEPTTHQKMAIDKAMEFLEKMGYDVKKYPILIGNLGQGVLGTAKNETIFLSERVFLQGVKQVTTTLLEEYLHLEHGLVDETYEMQNFLFDMIIQQAEIGQGVVL